MPVFQDKNILIDQRTNDDAAVYRINENQALLGTLDFFTPIVDDPYYFGAIAAANSLSDIYAMGGTPLFAMNIVGFPTNRLPLETLEAILKGAYDKAKEAGIGILGGHTIDDTEPKFGMVVVGIADPEKLLRNSGAQPGDDLILTKPIGTGIISTAIKKGIVSKSTMDYTIQLMARLNMIPAEIARKYPVSACTDITGFGLLGHLLEMTRSSETDAVIFTEKVPVIEDTVRFAESEIIPGGSKSNLKYVSEYLRFNKNTSYVTQIILADAQTSGGLLISVPGKYSKALLKDLKVAGITEAALIGKIEKKGKGYIHLVN
jgi:selenide,water dikinase